MRIIKCPIFGLSVDLVKEINLLKKVYLEVIEFKEDVLGSLSIN